MFEIYSREVLTWETLLYPMESHIDLVGIEMALKILLFFPRDCQQNPGISHDTTEHGRLCSPEPYETSLQSGVPLGISGGSFLQRFSVLGLLTERAESIPELLGLKCISTDTEHRWSRRQSPRDGCCSPR